MYLNQVMLIGNLTRDPELKALPGGTQVANFSVATNRTWKDKDGAKQEAVEYHNVVSFGRTAEVIGQYVKKGHQIFVTGRLQTRSWDDKESGKKQYRTEIVVDTFQFGNNKPAGSTSSAAPARDPLADEFDGRDAPDTNDPIQFPAEASDAEDIPF